MATTKVTNFSLQLSRVLSGEMKLKRFVREKSVEKIKLESLKLAENDLELRARLLRK